jgi:hypothetical protein
MLYQHSGRPELAVRDYDRYVAGGPVDVGVFYYRGLALEELAIR